MKGDFKSDLHQHTKSHIIHLNIFAVVCCCCYCFVLLLKFKDHVLLSSSSSLLNIQIFCNTFLKCLLCSILRQILFYYYMKRHYGVENNAKCIVFVDCNLLICFVFFERFCAYTVWKRENCLSLVWFGLAQKIILFYFNDD